MYMTFDEIVADVLENLHEEDRQYIRANRKEIEAVWFDGSFGRHIRNHYNLWAKDNPLTMLNYVPEMRKVQINEAGDIVDDEEGCECDCNPKHPDNVSAQILKEVYKQIRAA